MGTWDKAESFPPLTRNEEAGAMQQLREALGCGPTSLPMSGLVISAGPATRSAPRTVERLVGVWGCWSGVGRSERLQRKDIWKRQQKACRGMFNREERMGSFVFMPQ